MCLAKPGVKDYRGVVDIPSTDPTGEPTATEPEPPTPTDPDPTGQAVVPFDADPTEHALVPTGPTETSATGSVS